MSKLDAPRVSPSLCVCYLPDVLHYESLVLHNLLGVTITCLCVKAQRRQSRLFWLLQVFRFEAYSAGYSEAGMAGRCILNTTKTMMVHKLLSRTQELTYTHSITTEHTDEII